MKILTYIGTKIIDKGQYKNIKKREDFCTNFYLMYDKPCIF